MSDHPGAVRGARRFACAFLSLFAFPAATLAQSVSIDAGASWRVGDGAMDLDCATLQVAGALHAQDGTVGGIGDLGIVAGGEVAATTAELHVGGDWRNHGGFVAGTGTVHLVDRCDAGSALIEGTTSFASLLIESARGKAYGFEAGMTQSIALALRLAGAPGVPLPIRSTQAGTRAGLALDNGASQQVTWVDVADMAAPEGSAWIASGLPAAFDSIDSGNNFRWFQPSGPPAPPRSVPTASIWALLIMALVLARLGGLRLRRR